MYYIYRVRDQYDNTYWVGQTTDKTVNNSTWQWHIENWVDCPDALYEAKAAGCEFTVEYLDVCEDKPYRSVERFKRLFLGKKKAPRHF